MSSSNEETGTNRLLAAAGVFGTVGVVAGAFGAHALRESLEVSGKVDVWQTAVLYNLLHAVACMAVISGGAPRMRSAVWLWLIGIGLFSGSLYFLALGGPKWLGPVTPLGGAFLVAGWLWITAGVFTGKRGGSD